MLSGYSALADEIEVPGLNQALPQAQLQRLAELGVVGGQLPPECHQPCTAARANTFLSTLAGRLTELHAPHHLVPKQRGQAPLGKVMWLML